MNGTLMKFVIYLKNKRQCLFALNMKEAEKVMPARVWLSVPNVLFVSPTNVLAEELAYKYHLECITINSFFGFNAEGETKHMKQFDASNYNCIVFDEIFFYSTSNLVKIFNYVKNLRFKKCQNF